jgi:HAMP domain-containing protein
MRFPLRRQILLPMVGIVLLTIGVVSALNAWLASNRVQRQIETQLVDVQRTLSAGNFPLESNVLRQTRGLTGAEFVVATPAGEVLAASDDGFSDLAGANHVHRIVRLDRGPVGGGQFILHAFYPKDNLREAQRQAVWPPLAIGGLAIALVAAAAFLVARQVTRPIQQLRSQVERIAQGNFQPVPAPSRDDEVRDLVAAVNQMAEKLAHYEEETRKSERLRTLGTLGGGIAHQIRNAATGCRIADRSARRLLPMATTKNHSSSPCGSSN